MSGNVIYEDMRQVEQASSYMLNQEPGSPPLTHMLTLKRGSAISVHITLVSSNLAPLYRAVDHATSHDNAAFHGDPLVLDEYCPYPLPDKYHLQLTMHKVCDYTTMKLSVNSCLLCSVSVRWPNNVIVDVSLCFHSSDR